MLMRWVHGWRLGVYGYAITMRVVLRKFSGGVYDYVIHERTNRGNKAFAGAVLLLGSRMTDECTITTA